MSDRRFLLILALLGCLIGLNIMQQIEINDLIGSSTFVTNSTAKDINNLRDRLTFVTNGTADALNHHSAALKDHSEAIEKLAHAIDGR